MTGRATLEVGSRHVNRPIGFRSDASQFAAKPRPSIRAANPED
jgi:hypothetical protein